MKDRIVVVTGASRGIGRAICRRFGQSGAMVVATARTADQLEQTKSLVESEGGRCFPHTCDVTSTEQLHGLIEQTARRFGRIDTLINNAGYAACAPAAEMSPTEFETLLRVNVAAVFYACTYVWPVMTKQGGGVIVNISSAAADDPFPGLGTYGASKAWVNTFTKGLAAEGKAAGIRVFAVAPGAVETDMLRAHFPDFPAEQTLDPMNVADTVHALTQPPMASASGQTFRVQK